MLYVISSNRRSVNLRALENWICGLRCIERDMRSILRTVRVYCMCQNSLRNLTKTPGTVGRVLRFRPTQLAMDFRDPSLNARTLRLLDEQGVWGKFLQLEQMKQADCWAAAQHLLSLFSSPFLYDYGLRRFLILIHCAHAKFYYVFYINLPPPYNGQSKDDVTCTFQWYSLVPGVFNKFRR